MDVLNELKLGGTFLRNTVIDVSRTELRAGADPEDLISNMVKAARDYEASVSKLQRPVKMETFFGDGMWRNSNLLPWRREVLTQHGIASVGTNFEKSKEDADGDEGTLADWHLRDEHSQWQDARVEEEIALRYPGDELDKKLREISADFWRRQANSDLFFQTTERGRRVLLMRELRRSILQEISVDFEIWRTTVKG